MRTLDPGTMGGDAGRSAFLLGMLAVTLFGIFIISALIGIINTGLEGKLDELRKGQSRVVESGHTVILGWSQEIFTVVSRAGRRQRELKRSAIVILADRDKGEMDDEIRARLPDTGRTSDRLPLGRPDGHRRPRHRQPPDVALDRHPLARGRRPGRRRHQDDAGRHQPPQRRPEPYHIVAELRDAANIDVARMVGGDEAELILSGDLISRIVAQTCRQTGLSIVYTELLDFDGDEIYFASSPELVGQTFGDALLAFEDSAADRAPPAGAVPTLNPPMDTVIAAGDQLIVIAEDDDTIRLATDVAPVDEAAIRIVAARTEVAPERTLVLGWNRRAPTIIRELDGYVAPGSAVVGRGRHRRGRGGARRASPDARATRRSDSSGPTPPAAPCSRRSTSASFDHIVVLCYSDSLETQRADSRTIITLLHLRDIAASATATTSRSCPRCSTCAIARWPR